MNYDFAAAMRRAALLTRASNVAQATRVIRDALAGGSAPVPSGTGYEVEPSPRQLHPDSRLIETDAGAAGTSRAPELTGVLPHDLGSFGRLGGARSRGRMRQPLGVALKALREGRLGGGAINSLPGLGSRPSQEPSIPDGAQFLTKSFSCAAGKRDYKLYIPTPGYDRPRGLVVMLHGCRQDSDDFATGTKMNAVCEAYGLLVAYPAQTSSANLHYCWNWFNPADQVRDSGEPSIIAGITREIIAEFRIDRRQVFVAGLSAGGAMAAVMGETYPDLYSAAGVHSGLVFGAANDVVSAFAAMRGDGTGAFALKQDTGELNPRARLIVFQGSADQTVSPANAGKLVEAAKQHIREASVRRERGSSAGRKYTRSLVAERDGTAAVECWMVDGAGHAWSGGHPAGSYTDPQGPDASAEIVRFFLEASAGPD